MAELSAIQNRPLRVLISDWAWLRRDDLPPGAEVTLSRILTVYPKSQRGTPKPIHQWITKPDWFGVPREWYFWTLSAPHHQVRYALSPGNHWPDEATFAATLYPDQAACIREVTSRVVAPSANPQAIRPLGCVIKAPTASGKTALSIALLSNIRRCAVILVHKKFLFYQWLERIAQFAPHARVGVIMGSRRTYQNCDIIVAMMQTVAAWKHLPEDLISQVGVTVVDETHRASCPVLGQAVTRFRPSFRFGLTATPERKDKTECVYYNHIGPIQAEIKKLRLTPKIKLLATNFLAPRKAQEHEIQEAITHDAARSRLIAAEATRALTKDRNIIILSKRLEHLQNLAAALSVEWRAHTARINHPLPAWVVEAESVAEALDVLNPCPKIMYCVGGTPQAEVEEATLTARVILATAQYVEEAFDAPRLDTLFLAMPMVSVQQAVGRILRTHPTKKDPIVVDVVDPLVPSALRQFRKRQKVYAKIGAVYCDPTHALTPQ